MRRVPGRSGSGPAPSRARARGARSRPRRGGPDLCRAPRIGRRRRCGCGPVRSAAPPGRAACSSPRRARPSPCRAAGLSGAAPSTWSRSWVAKLPPSTSATRSPAPSNSASTHASGSPPALGVSTSRLRCSVSRWLGELSRIESGPSWIGARSKSRLVCVWLRYVSSIPWSAGGAGVAAMSRPRSPTSPRWRQVTAEHYRAIERSARGAETPVAGDHRRSWHTLHRRESRICYCPGPPSAPRYGSKPFEADAKTDGSSGLDAPMGNEHHQVTTNEQPSSQPETRDPPRARGPLPAAEHRRRGRLCEPAEPGIRVRPGAGRDRLPGPDPSGQPQAG